MQTGPAAVLQSIAANWEIGLVIIGAVAAVAETRIKLHRLQQLHTPDILIEETRRVSRMESEIDDLKKQAEDRRQDVRDLHAKIDRSKD